MEVGDLCIVGKNGRLCRITAVVQCQLYPYIIQYEDDKSIEPMMEYEIRKVY